MTMSEYHIDNRQLQHIARISRGKDSMKMLDVIFTRGLPLDRITTTDVWATDTIRGEHPKMVEFSDMADEYIWRKYRIEVEHLCAMRNGEKLTYEKLFYHVPKRKNAGGLSDKGQYSASRPCGDRGANRTSNEPHETRIQGFPAQIGSWCKKLKIDYTRLPSQRPANRAMVHQTQNEVFRQPRNEGQ